MTGVQTCALPISGLHIYVDGSEASYSASQDGTATPNTAGLEWFVGSSWTADLGIDGRLAELGWWNRVLDAGEIASLAAGFSPRCMPRGLKWAPDMVRPVTDPVTGQVGTLSGTSVLAHPAVFRPVGPIRDFVSGNYTPAAQARVPWHLLLRSAI